jgi:hypothetical protein
MKRSLAELVAAVPPRTVQGTFYRHAAVDRDAFAGGIGGRWGQAFPVIYLGRPPDSIVVEAYRHLVEEAGIPASSVRPRTLYTVRAQVSRVLDLTVPANLIAVGLTVDDLDTSVDDYRACQDVAAAAHQMQYHAVLAPAATGLGETLALFRNRVDANELPVITTQAPWSHGLPADPRIPRLAGETVRRRPTT